MPELKLYNTLSRREEVFQPRDAGKVSIYACGLTPQAPPHVGHMRGVVVMDVICRWFRQLGYDVHFVQNFTDIDDKIIRRANEEGISTTEVAEKYSKMYIEDSSALGSETPHFVTVTGNMQEIIEMVAKLVEKGYAYEVDGDVYYVVEKFEEYGKLSGRSVDEMRAGARIEVDERKRNPMDFALWKAAKPGEPAWESPWGPGRPGWHIECSALSLKYLGAEFDIHAGGTDLIFPHHENEIAQSEAYLEKQSFCRYWIHWGAVRLDKDKMSKSVGNVVQIREILQDYEAGVIRLYLLSTSYRTPIEFSYERLDESKVALERIRTAIQRAGAMLRALPQLPEPDEAAAEFYKTRFAEGMNADFNTAQGISVAFDIVSDINQQLSEAGLTGSLQHPERLLALVNTLQWMLQDVFGIAVAAGGAAQDELLNHLMNHVIAWRHELRAQRNFALADRIRDDLKSIGILLEDSVQGTTWRRG